MSSIIELNNISKTFDKKKKIIVLKNLNFKFKKGKIYSLSGPSGSGKSTLLNILGMLDTADKGDYILDSFKIENLNLRVQNEDMKEDLGNQRII